MVREVMHNHDVQAELPEEHPAAVFGQSVQPSAPTPYELDMSRNARMQTLATAFTSAQAIGSTSLLRVQDALQRAIDDALLPPGETTDQYVDSAAILLERGYDGDQIMRLAPELGKDMKMVYESEGRGAQSNEQHFGRDRHQVGLYHRVRDAGLIEDVLASFKQRPLHARVMAGGPDPAASRRQALLLSQGRGRSASQRPRPY